MKKVKGYIGHKVQLSHNGNSYFAFTLISKQPDYYDDNKTYYHDALFVEPTPTGKVSDMTLRLAFLPVGSFIEVTVDKDIPEDDTFWPTLTNRREVVSIR